MYSQTTYKPGIQWDRYLCLGMPHLLRRGIIHRIHYWLHNVAESSILSRLLGISVERGYILRTIQARNKEAIASSAPLYTASKSAIKTASLKAIRTWHQYEVERYVIENYVHFVCGSWARETTKYSTPGIRGKGFMLPNRQLFLSEKWIRFHGTKWQFANKCPSEISSNTCKVKWLMTNLLDQRSGQTMIGRKSN